MELPEWILQYKEPHTAIKCIKGHYYKYEVYYKYNVERRRSIVSSTKLLGKITKRDGFILSSKNTFREECQKPPKVDVKTYGIYAIFSTLLKEEIVSLQAAFGQEIADILISFAMIRWAYQSPIKRVADYHSHDFCSEIWSPENTLSDKRITATLKNVGQRRDDLVKWMRSLLPEAAAKSENFLLMDSTHIMSESENLAINVPGYNPSFDFGKQVRLMYMFPQDLKQPVYYRLINGNIPDISSVSMCLKEMDVKNLILIADKGFYSKDNIELLKKNGIQNIIPVRRNHPAIDYSVLQSKNFKEKSDFFFYQNRTIWYYQYEVDGEKYVTFLDDRLRVEEEHDYLQRIAERTEDYTKENFNKKLCTFGTLTITYNINSLLSAEQLYGIYKQRNEIEVMFRNYKNFLEADKMHMQNKDVLEGWLFVNFLAMIAYYKLFEKLRAAGLLNKLSPKDVIEQSRSVYQLRIRETWNRSEIPVKTRKFYKKIGIDILT